MKMGKLYQSKYVEYLWYLILHIETEYFCNALYECNHKMNHLLKYNSQLFSSIDPISLSIIMHEN